MAEIDEKTFEQELLEEAEAHCSVSKAITTALLYGSIDGARHKMWVIDQMLRALAGQDYDRYIALYEQDDSEWDTGIAP